MNIEKHINLMGLPCTDKVTSLTGVITGISFDLFGCVQALLHPGIDKDGKLQDPIWFDVSRLTIIGDIRVMDLPDFEQGYIAEGKKGAAEKPVFNKA